MNKLIIKSGKFYRNGVYERPEHGNKEQIETLKRYEREGDVQKEGKVVYPEFEVEVSAEVNFECVCGKNLWKSMDDVIEDDIECFVNQKVTCRDCGRDYVFDINDVEELVVKLV